MLKNLKKGFTLIELLAVIVILAIIALIATPMILGVIERAKESSAESSSKGYIDAVEKQIATNLLDSNSSNDIIDNVYEVSELKEKQVSVKGELPTDDSWVQIEHGEVTSCSLKFKEYTVNCNGDVVKDGKIETKPNGVIKSGPTKEEAKSTDTHKGIVYLDPTDLTKTCTKEMAESNLNENGTSTEIKTGCMKWYIYDDTGDEYKLLLDHNTTARIKWNNSGKNVAYEESNLYSVVNDLKNVSGWIVNPRLITAEEVSIIVGKTDWTYMNNYYYFDSKTTSPSATSKGASKYAWLYDNLCNCESAGCNINDNNGYIEAAVSSATYGYWTSTTAGTAGSGPFVWLVYYDGRLNVITSNYTSHGIRPVITISKSIIS